MNNVTRSVGRPRTIDNDKLNSIKRMAKARKLTLKQACNMSHAKYGSVIAAAKTLRHPVRSLIKVYRARVA